VQLADRVNRISISPTAAFWQRRNANRAQGADWPILARANRISLRRSILFGRPFALCTKAARNIRPRRGSARCEKPSASGTRRNSVRPTRCRNAS